MMSIWCNKIPTVALRSYHHRISLGTFIKHLSSIQIPSNRNKKTITTSALHTPNLQTLTPRQKEQISLYVNALLEWNQRMNLTAVTETSEVMKRHVEDSLAIIPPIQSSYLSRCGSSCDHLNLVDVGSGPGLPGLIFAIACPGWKVTLLESMKKRCLFLEHAVDLTGLSNVQVLRERAENAGQSLDFREVFDVAVARAVAEMRILAEYCIPLVRVGGLFVAAKGYDPQEEVRNAKSSVQLLGASILQLCSVESHSPYGQRTAVICLKDRPTPRKYPRLPGIPAKTPL
ncbi:S-adenosyl-L-methionine-dependent methyltransferases superfamily protein isoform X2 [Tasmannia lanceolata]